MSLYQPCRSVLISILSVVFVLTLPIVLSAEEKQSSIVVDRSKPNANLSENPGSKTSDIYETPLSLKRKFIESGILYPQIKLSKKQQPNFPVFSNSVFIPKFFDSHERFERIDLSNLGRLRFLTTTDFYPFNYADENHNLAGYHVDLVRALCAELHLENICRIEAVPWAELQTRMQAREADALIAGLAPNKENRAFLSFSRSYLRFPARFIGLDGSKVVTDSRDFGRQGHDFSEFLLRHGSGLRVGVIRDTAHQKLLENYFAARVVRSSNPPSKNLKNEWFSSSAIRQSGAWGEMVKKYTNGDNNILQAIPFASNAEMIALLKEKKIDLAFGDGMGFALLISSQMADKKTQSVKEQQFAPNFVFLGNFYPGPGYLGQGLQIAVLQNNDRLVAAFNYALQQLEHKGTLAELYLRYFPVGFY